MKFKPRLDCGPNSHDPEFHVDGELGSFSTLLLQPPAALHASLLPEACHLLLSCSGEEVFEGFCVYVRRVGTPSARERGSLARSRRPGALPSWRQFLGRPSTLKDNLIAVAEERPRASG